VANVVNVASASILSSIGLWIVGTPAAILLGIFAGFGEIVPNIGPPIAAVPAVLITLLNDPAKTPWVILMFVIVQTIQGYGLSPLVMKHNVELPPLATILAVLGMGTLFGFLGVLVAVPLTADLVVIWNYVNRSLEKRLKQQDNDVTNDPPAEVRERPPHRPGR
jgi:predicted PurR-regulated permease PerM